MAINNLDIQDVARYIGLSMTTKGFSISPLKLQKMLYYAQAWFMAFYGRKEQLFADIPQAWVNGPVYPQIYYSYRDKTNNMCDHLNSSDFYEGDANEGFKLYAGKMGFNDDQKETIESIIMNYGSLSQNELIFLTHSESPWADARKGLAPYEKSQKEISLDQMCDYYKGRYDRNRGRR